MYFLSPLGICLPLLVFVVQQCNLSPRLLVVGFLVAMPLPTCTPINISISLIHHNGLALHTTIFHWHELFLLSITFQNELFLLHPGKHKRHKPYPNFETCWPTTHATPLHKKELPNPPLISMEMNFPACPTSPNPATSVHLNGIFQLLPLSSNFKQCCHPFSSKWILYSLQPSMSKCTSLTHPLPHLHVCQQYNPTRLSGLNYYMFQ